MDNFRKKKKKKKKKIVAEFAQFSPHLLLLNIKALQIANRFGHNDLVLYLLKSSRMSEIRFFLSML
jgi:hypothetical protein